MDSDCRDKLASLKLEAARNEHNLKAARDAYVAAYATPFPSFETAVAALGSALVTAANVKSGIAELRACPGLSPACHLSLAAAWGRASSWLEKVKSVHDRALASFALMIFGHPAVATAGMATVQELSPFDTLVDALNDVSLMCPAVVDAQAVDPHDDVDLVLRIRAADGKTFTTPESEKIVGSHFETRVLQKPGSMKRFIIHLQCTDFEVESWRLRARADVGGGSAPIFGQWAFEWTIEGKVVPHQVSSDRTSTIDEVVPAGKSVKVTVSATATAGTVKEAVNAMTVVVVPKKRSVCEQAPG